MLKSVQRETCAHVHQLIVTNEQFHLAMHREGVCFCFLRQSYYVVLQSWNLLYRLGDLEYHSYLPVSVSQVLIWRHAPPCPAGCPVFLVI